MSLQLTLDGVRLAAAEEEEGHATTAAEEHKEPNPILPAKGELFWGALSFIVLVALLWKVGAGSVKKTMDDRTERIRGDLESAEAAKTEAQRVLDDYRAQLADARNESGRIIEEARQQADALKRDLAVRAEADIAEMRTRAATEIEGAKVQAMADLRAEVANLAIGAAEVVIERNLDRDAQVNLVDQFIARVGANNG